ncbi:UNVERIFIED_CONTAM: hypothetical protein Slati_0148300 [Sesamum latifolium]|uniref:Reverse transcriptase n=1 Tax=Sesamum latifolium TaxID=2727402 RepID=A0AAW2YAZ2_9LAMI
MFAMLKNHMWGKMQNWRVKRLSQAGQTVLIKAVTQAIPTYIMGCFLLPEELLSNLESMLENFFWQRSKKQSIHWLNWKKLCMNNKLAGWVFGT